MEIGFAGVVLGAPDPRALAGFYEALLPGWTRFWDEPDWVQLRGPGGGRPSISFQAEPDHTAPVWPAGRDDQQMQLHLDFAVDDLDEAVEHAVDCGARVADEQPQDDVRVLIDPAGHPFCLFVNGA